MIHDVDQALEQLLNRGLREGVEVTFAPPTRVEARVQAGEVTGTVVDLHLLDVREEGDMTAVGVARARADDGSVSRERPPRWFRLSYWLTAWAAEASDEHEALGAALATLAAHDTVPADLLGGALAGSERPVRLQVATPPAGEAFAASVWASLRTPMKGAVHVAVLVPVAARAGAPPAKAVRERRLSMTGPPPPPKPTMSPPPGVPAVLMPVGMPPRPAGVPGAPGMPPRAPGVPGVPGVPAPPAAAAPPPPEASKPPRPAPVEEVVYAPDGAVLPPT